jgi:SAM-dependent methyltransferase
MKTTNRLIKKSDIVWAKKITDENRWIEKYPHSTSLGNHWNRDEALLKWVFAIFNFGIGTGEKKVIDLGFHNGCVPHVVSDWGNETIALDKLKSKWGQSKSSASIIIEDAFTWLPKLEDESVDVFFDLCAVHLFDDSSNKDCGNLGLLKISELVFQKLKPGGKFIISSDVGNSKTGEFITPEIFIEIVEKSGLKLTSEFDGTIDNDTFYNGNHKVVSLTFEK